MAIKLFSTDELPGYDIAKELYNCVTTADNQAKIFHELSHNLAFSLDDEELNEIVRVHPTIPLTWDLMGPALEKLCQRNLPEEQFYFELWRFIFDGSLFSDEEEKTCAVFCMLVNPRIPYICFDLPTMAQDEFDQRRRNLKRQIRALNQVVRRSFPQRTQEALAALRIIDGCDSQDDKAVAMAMFLSSVRDTAS